MSTNRTDSRDRKPAVDPTHDEMVMACLLADLDTARRNYANAEELLLGAINNGHAPGRIEQLEQQLDHLTAELRDAELALQAEKYRRDQQDDEKWAAEHPDATHDAYMNAEGNPLALGATAARLERELRRCTRLEYTSTRLEREWRATRAAMWAAEHPEWLDRYIEERSAIEEWGASAMAKKFLKNFRRTA